MTNEARCLLAYAFLIVAMGCNLMVCLMTDSRPLGIVTIIITCALLGVGKMLKGITKDD